ncbi:MAG: hypothetical protein M1819_004355 [Sarea resinae]|nr:MAG: hypothetical protein M1819_004355 [Sarea resinae]
MEDEGRGFEETNVLVSGVQKGEERTALSQTRNLYFAGYMDKIHVYRPQFPYQSLSSKPAIVLSPPVSRPGLPGYIDHRAPPHAINHLIVGDLGDDEILCCACDDGDVVAYSIRSIAHAVERADLVKEVDASGNGTTRMDEVRHFFLENVGMSAWGLAIHKAARMIAVSANTHAITVYAFGLTQQNENNSPEPPNENDAMQSSALLISSAWHDYINTHFARRDVNFKISLIAHQENVPSVTFCNTDDDLHGKWLVSTDIAGCMVIWDVWGRKTIKVYKFGQQSLMRVPYGAFSTESRRGWGVLCIDPRSFRATRTIRETFGCKPELIKGAWDITASRQEVRDTSIWHSGWSGLNPSIPGDIVDVVDDEDDDEENYGDGDIEDDGDNDNEIDVAPEFFLLDQLSESSTLPSPNLNSQILALDNDYAAEEQHSPSSISTASTTTFSPPTPRRSTLTPTTFPTSSQQNEPLPFSILHTTETDLRFVSRPPLRSRPTIAAQAPLLQRLPPALQHLDQIDRLNLLVQIPELGVVVVGSQIGRVVVLRLTRYTDMKGKKASKKKKDNGPRGQKEEDVLGGINTPWGDGTDQEAFRIDRILPFRSQEAQGQRPDVPLLGISAGPIQGREIRVRATNAGKRKRGLEDDDDEDDSDDAGDDTSEGSDESRGQGRGDGEAWRAVEGTRRYRLLLHYYDNSVLSYELGRDECDGVGGGAGASGGGGRVGRPRGGGLLIF